MLRLHSLVFVIIILSVPSLSSVQAFAIPQTANPPAMATRVYDKASIFRKEDARLAKRISLDRPQVYAGELLEIFAEQTGVSIEASDTDGAAGEELVAVLKDIPLADAMECLTSLLSHKGIRWQWRREGNGQDEPYVYRLMRPENAITSYAEQTKAQIQTDFEDEAAMVIAGLDMSPAELKNKGNDNVRMGFLASDSATQFGIRALRDSFTSEQRLNLLRDKKGVSIRVSDLSPAGQKLKDYMLGVYQSSDPGHVYNIDSASFSVSESPFPVLWIGFGDLGGWSYLGGPSLQNTFSKREMNSWLHENETKIDTNIEAQTVPKPKDHDHIDAFPERNPNSNRLAYMAEKSNFSLMARLERDTNKTPQTEPWEMAVGAYITDIEPSLTWLHKWHKTPDGKSILLIDYIGWYSQDTDPEHPRFPWQVMKKFRQMDIDGNNEALLQAMLSAAATFDDEQMHRFGNRQEYPIASWVYR